MISVPGADLNQGADMLYAELSYFEGYHFAHIAAFEDHLQRQHTRRRIAHSMSDRRQRSRTFTLQW